MSYVSAELTIRVDDDLQTLLDQACDLAGRNRSDLVRDALRRQLALTAFEELRRAALPHASRAGFETDEDVFGAVS
ncbi:MAG: CopG family transcriptional regulator [Verrucomicrobiae bacterium]|nr:CopG family transcriptional regulator [Verrucomicrobiae bacterium]